MALLRPNPTALALARFKRGVSQDELAARADVAPSTIQRLEAGELPRLRTALKIAAALEADAAELFLDSHDEERVGA